jgi:hypothetical protein
LGPIPNPQSPIPNPQSPIYCIISILKFPFLKFLLLILYFNFIIILDYGKRNKK